MNYKAKAKSSSILASEKLLPLAALALFPILTSPAFGEAANFVSATNTTTCAVSRIGEIWCWGYNGLGKLGNNTTTDSPTPVRSHLPNLEGTTSHIKASAISTGNSHTCAAVGLKTYCWGTGTVGQLALGSTKLSLTPSASDVQPSIKFISSSERHSCALTDNGRVMCWGWNQYGQLGNGDPMSTNISPPKYVVGISGSSADATAISITTAGQHSCALLMNGRVKCWGYNNTGQLGDGTITSRITPVDVLDSMDVSGKLSHVKMITAGEGHTCALLSSGGVKCWGDNGTQVGILGNGTTVSHSTSPVAVRSLVSARMISAGYQHTCAVTEPGTVHCWGYNLTKQLGNDSTANSSTPVRVNGLGTRKMVSVATGFEHSCAIDEIGAVMCWGGNRHGQLGNGTASNTPVGVPVKVEGFAGYTHTLGLVPPASSQRQGFVRVINRSAQSGQVKVTGIDSFGIPATSSMTFTLAPQAVLHFSSDEIATGNPAKLNGSLGTGTPGHTNWTLNFETDLPIEVMSLARHPQENGFLTSLHPIIVKNDLDYEVPIMNPGSNLTQLGSLRLTNIHPVPVWVSISGVDDKGVPGEEEVTLILPALASVELTSADLENGKPGTTTGKLGDRTGKWRLRVSPTEDIRVHSLMYSGGKMTNLSTSVGTGEAGAKLSVALSAADPLREGFVRINNPSDSTGTVTVSGFDANGQASTSAMSFSLAPWASMNFSAAEMQNGNPAKGLNGSLGTTQAPRWALQFATSLPIQAMSLARNLEDGFLMSLHEQATQVGADWYVPMINPGTNNDQASLLLLVNPTDSAINVTLRGVDDSGHPGQSPVTLAVPARASVTLTSMELESGKPNVTTGAFSLGQGKWQVTVSASGPLKVHALMQSGEVNLTNVSTTADPDLYPYP